MNKFDKSIDIQVLISLPRKLVKTKKDASQFKISSN